MASNNTSLLPSGYTYTNSWKPTTNYANISPIEICGSSFSLHGESKVILQFDIPPIVTGSKISSATLNFDLKALWDSSQTPSSDLTLVYPMFYSGAIANGYVYSAITHSNYSTLISQSTKTQFKSFSGEQHYNSNQVDVTSIVANNINNNVLTIVLEGIQSYQSQQINASSISLAISYEAVDPVTPLVVSPNGTYENRKNNIKFEWMYKSQTEAIQARAEIGYKSSKSSSYTIVNVYSRDNYYILPANALNTEVIEWRVRTTDSDGKVSDYAYGSFTVIDSPAVPVITTIENKCISNIIWSSADQVALEIEIYKENDLVYIRKVSSSSNTYKPNMFFANTTYTIKLRVGNMYGLWSEWGSKVFAFTFTNPTQPIALVTQANNAITIKTDTVGSILYKSKDNGVNYIPIYKFDDSKVFTDYKVANNKIYKYFIRKYVDGYTDSKIQIAQVCIKGIIIQSNNKVVKAVLSNEQFMPYSESLYTEKALNNYVGRVYPVCEFGEHIERTLTREFLLDKISYETLQSIHTSFTTVMYRDSFGNMFPCSIDIVPGENAIMNTMYNVSVTLTQIDEQEEISVYE